MKMFVHVALVFLLKSSTLLGQEFEWVHTGSDDKQMGLHSSRFKNHTLYLAGGFNGDYLIFGDSLIYPPKDLLPYYTSTAFIAQIDTNGIMKNVYFFKSDTKLNFDVNEKGEIAILRSGSNANGNSIQFIELIDATGNPITKKVIETNSICYFDDIRFDWKDCIYLGGSITSIYDTDVFEDSTFTLSNGYSLFLAKFNEKFEFQWLYTSQSVGGSIAGIKNISIEDEEVAFSGVYYTFPMDSVKGGLVIGKDTLVSKPYISSSGGIQDTTYQVTDLVIGKADVNGNPVWAKSLGNDLHDYSREILFQDSKIYSISKSDLEYSGIWYNATLNVFDPIGNLQWYLELSNGTDYNNSSIRGISVNEKGLITIGGGYAGQINIKDSTYVPQGNGAFLMTLTEDNIVDVYYNVSGSNSSWFESLYSIGNKVFFTGSFKYSNFQGTGLTIGTIKLNNYKSNGSMFWGKYSLIPLPIKDPDPLGFLTAPSVQVYPNPVDGGIIRVNSNAEGLFQLYDLSGTLVLSKFIYSEINNIQVPMGLNVGIYLFKLDTKEKSISGKLIIN